MADIGDRVRKSIPPEMTQGQLAQSIGMTADAMSRSLRGQRHFSALELGDIAQLLDLDLHWLITGAPDPSSALTFAARHNYEAKERHSTGNDIDLLQRVNKAYQVAYRGESARFPRKLPRTSQAITSRIGELDSRRLYEQLQAVGVDIIVLPELGTAYSFTSANHVILVPGHRNWHHMNFSVGHELAHLALGHVGHRANSADEWPATVFAAELWMPEQTMRAVDWSTLEAPVLARWVWERGVSLDAVKRRLNALGITNLSEDVASALASPTQKFLRQHIGELPAGPDGRDPILAREEASRARHFPDDLVLRLTESVEDGSAAPDLLAWATGVDVDDLDIEWPDEKDARPLPASPLEAMDADALLIEK